MIEAPNDPLETLQKMLNDTGTVIIRVSKEVYAEIAKRADPLSDTPDSALRKAFGLPPKEKRKKDP